jgi:hypothetical protein
MISVVVITFIFIIIIIIIIIGTATLCGRWHALKIFSSHPVLVPSHSWSTFLPIPFWFYKHYSFYNFLIFSRRQAAVDRSA